MSSNQWKTCLIGDIGRIITGKTPSTKNSKNFGNKYPFITPRDMFGQKKVWQTERYLSEAGKNEVKNCLLPANAVCISCIGSDMGKVVMTTQESVTNQQLNSIICDNSFDPEFVYYGVINISSDLKNVAHHSTAVPILNKTDFSNFEFRFPDIYAQKRIASILTALDDKLELNRQTNQTLEAIAQAIYKEWFVNFNFPGATGEMQDSELGSIPKGWRIGKLGEYISFVKGRKPKETAEKHVSNFLPQILIETLDSEKYIFANPENMIICDENELIMVMDGASSGRIEFGIKGVVGSTLAVVKKVNFDFPYYLYQLLKLKEADIKANTTGSSIPHADKHKINDYDFIIPDSRLLRRYDDTAESIYKLIIKNKDKIQVLSKIRDGLLPRFMNGDIEV